MLEAAAVVAAVVVVVVVAVAEAAAAEREGVEALALANLIALNWRFSISSMEDGRLVLNFFALAFNRSTSISVATVLPPVVPTWPFAFFRAGPSLA